MKWGLFFALFFLGLAPCPGLFAATARLPETASVATPSRGVGSGGETVAPAGVLTLREALELALQENPELRAGAASVRAAAARTHQSRALPNPEVELGLSEYDRSGKGFDSAEIDVTVVQRLELGGKRHWRVRQAEAEGALAGWDETTLRLDVRAETARRHIAVVAAQRRLALAAVTAAVAEGTAAAVVERVQAGKEPPFRTAKAKADLSLARLDQATARQTLGAARAALAAMWGSEHARFEAAEDRLADDLQTPLDVARLAARLPFVPELARGEQVVRLRESALAAERSQRIPDVEVFAGVQRFEEDDSHAFALGVALPLPLFDRNEGNIMAARHELDRARYERRAVEIALRADLTAAHALTVEAHGRALTLQNDVVPALTQAFEAAREGYRQGKFGFLDMRDAQSGLAEAQAALIDALETYHSARTRMERLTAAGAASKPTFNNNGTEE